MKVALLLGLMSVLGLLVGSVAVLRWTEGAISVEDAGQEMPTGGANVIAETPSGVPAAAEVHRSEVASSTDSATTSPTIPPASDDGLVTSARAAPARSGQPGLDPVKHQARIAFRGEIAAGLAALQKSVAPCQASDLTFTLDLETVEGGIRVLDASVASGANPEDARASCASAAVRGQVIPAPNALPGQHWQIPFSPHG